MTTSDDPGQGERAAERRAEARQPSEDYHSAEFRIDPSGYLFQTRIWNFSSRGMCLLLREDSRVIEKLAVGKELEVNYYPTDASRPPETRQTRIVHITREAEGKFKDHVLVGLHIMDEPEPPPPSS